MFVDVIDDLLRLGLEIPPIIAAIRVELGMGEVQDLFTAEFVLGLIALRKFQGFQGGFIAARVAELFG